MKSKLSVVKTVVVLVILILVGVLGVLGLSTAKTYLSGATAGYEPKNVLAVPDETEVIISWDSDKSSKAYVQYGTTPASLLLSVPSRDELQTAAGDSNHRISIKTFKPNTNYYFRIRVGDEVTAYNDWEVFDNGGIPYSFKTKGVTIAEGSPTPTVASIQPSTMVTPEVTPEMVDNGLLSQESCVTGVDYNHDGVINVLDVIFCRSEKNGTVKPVPTATASAATTPVECSTGIDYTGDGVINVLDIITCRQGKGR